MNFKKLFNIKEGKIDLGEWKVPVTWSDVTLKQVSDLERYYASKEEKDIRQIIAILANKTIDEVNDLPTEFFNKILTMLSFINTKPTNIDDVRKYVDIDGERYTVHTENELKTGEYVAADNVIKNDVYNYATLLAILCRKEGEIFDAKFENEVLEKRVELFENLPAVEVLPIVNFFLSSYVISELPSRLSIQAVEDVNHIQEAIQNSTQIGAFKKSYMNWQMKKLKKSLQSINSM